MLELLVLTWVLVSLVNPSSCQTGDDVYDLQTFLFTDRKYDKRIRPSLNQRKTTNVEVDLTLYSIDYVDEVTETMKTTSHLTLEWVDEYLTWEPSSYGGIQFAYWPQNDIWKPDIALTNSYKEYKPLGADSMRVRVSYDGNVTWNPFLVSVSTCSVDITYFPFDVQTCNLKFEAWSYPKAEVYLSGSLNVLNEEYYKESSAWTFVSTTWTIDEYSPASEIIYELTLKRKPLHFLLTILLPITLLSLLNIFVFVLPCESGERSGYAITVFLAFAVFLTIVSTALPENSDTVAIFSVYIVIQTIQSTLIMMIALVLIRMNCFDEDTSIPRPLLYFARLAMLDFRLKRKSTSVESLTKETVDSADQSNGRDGNSVDWTNNKSDEVRYTWRYVINGIDTFCFLLFFIILISTTVVCMAKTITLAN